jgi:hypothetical protein
MQKEHEQFDREWNKTQQDQEEFRKRNFPEP